MNYENGPESSRSISKTSKEGGQANWITHSSRRYVVVFFSYPQESNFARLRTLHVGRYEFIRPKDGQKVDRIGNFSSSITRFTSVFPMFFIERKKATWITLK